MTTYLCSAGGVEFAVRGETRQSAFNKGIEYASSLKDRGLGPFPWFHFLPVTETARFGCEAHEQVEVARFDGIPLGAEWKTCGEHSVTVLTIRDHFLATVEGPDQCIYSLRLCEAHLREYSPVRGVEEIIRMTPLPVRAAS